MIDIYDNTKYRLDETSFRTPDISIYFTKASLRITDNAIFISFHYGVNYVGSFIELKKYLPSGSIEKLVGAFEEWGYEITSDIGESNE